jgi:hypothetical protein
MLVPALATAALTFGPVAGLMQLASQLGPNRYNSNHSLADMLFSSGASRNIGRELAAKQDHK